MTGRYPIRDNRTPAKSQPDKPGGKPGKPKGQTKLGSQVTLIQPLVPQEVLGDYNEVDLAAVLTENEQLQRDEERDPVSFLNTQQRELLKESLGKKIEESKQVFEKDGAKFAISDNPLALLPPDMCDQAPGSSGSNKAALLQDPSFKWVDVGETYKTEFRAEIPELLRLPELEGPLLALLNNIFCAGPKSVNWGEIHPCSVTVKEGLVTYGVSKTKVYASNQEHLPLLTVAPGELQEKKDSAEYRPISVQAAASSKGPSQPRAGKLLKDTVFIIPHKVYDHGARRISIPQKFLTENRDLCDAPGRLVEKYLRDNKCYWKYKDSYDVTRSHPDV